jgi:sugar/nucleoside kinase (ribokinase family)
LGRFARPRAERHSSAAGSDRQAPLAARSYQFPVGKRFDVVGFGLNSVDHLCVVRRHPRLDSKQQLVTYERQPGGQVPTALVALQRWGLCTAYVGSFGDDAGGALSRTALADEGVELSASVIRTGTRQQVSVILIDEVSGERSVLSEHVPELILRADELPRETLVDGSVLLMDAVDMPTAVAAARAAKDQGILTVLDTDAPAAGIDALLGLTDVLIVAAEFPGQLTGSSDLRAALRHYVPAFRVPVVDSTGAGDIFHAGSIYGLLQAWPIPEVMRFAAAAAALKCEKLGGRPGIPTVERATALARSG